ncbi:septum formation protein Maf [Thermosynechococcus sp. NK55a]|jgi:septum formation protein|uniref:nucleoside triphosphate pyrophosphatase n=1 Tax=unclassified Thermosynechococcus TaxID=2622553 RepID=UPI0003D91CB0|nr:MULTISPECIES: nucleoside triphosphate pyrophosphatase [unclassified Thermosynechococcus]AHB87995.1 septum formation protein Maf [Thermosynechococcus sp. NK55a]
MVPFVLASASPARRQLLQQIGIDPIIQPSHFDESVIQATTPTELVRLLARCKAETVAQSYSAPALILGCDSVLVLGGEIYGKPASPEMAIARWQKMRGQTGDLLTGHALIDLAQGRTCVEVESTQVVFADISDAEIAAYVASGEPLACAGCFALDGQGGAFVEKIVGTPSNVIGLSLPLLRRLLLKLGYTLGDVQSKK